MELNGDTLLVESSEDCPSITRSKTNPDSEDPSMSWQDVDQPLINKEHVLCKTKPRLVVKNNNQKRPPSRKATICPVCGKKMTRSYNLKHHMEKCHGSEHSQHFACSFCCQIFKSKGHWQRHEAIHGIKPPFRCLACPKQFQLKNLLCSHILEEHYKESLLCPGCGRISSCREKFMYHRRRCRKYLKLPSPKDGISQEISSIIKAEISSQIKAKHITYPLSSEDVKSSSGHMLKQADQEQRFQCPDCKKQFKRKQNLRQHQKHHCGSKYACTLCTERFPLHPQLVDHQLQIHGIKVHLKDLRSCPRPAWKNSTIRSFLCDSCGVSYSTKYLLEKHKKSVHLGCEKMYKCEECAKSFKAFARLFDHMREHLGITPFQCSVCEESFTSTSLLRAHERKHVQEMPYTCQECGRLFKESYSLKEHLRTHSGDKPFLCKVCGQTFAHISTLRQHSRTHTGDKPFTCGECGKAFAQRATLTTHVKAHRGEKPYACHICGKAYSRMNTLNIHMTRHTGKKRVACPLCSFTCDTPKHLRKHGLVAHKGCQLQPSFTYNKNANRQAKNALFDVSVNKLEDAPATSRPAFNLNDISSEQNPLKNIFSSKIVKFNLSLDSAEEKLIVSDNPSNSQDQLTVSHDGVKSTDLLKHQDQSNSISTPQTLHSLNAVGGINENMLRPTSDSISTVHVVLTTCADQASQPLSSSHYPSSLSADNTHYHDTQLLQRQQTALHQLPPPPPPMHNSCVQNHASIDMPCPTWQDYSQHTHIHKSSLGTMSNPYTPASCNPQVDRQYALESLHPTIQYQASNHDQPDTPQSGGIIAQTNGPSQWPIPGMNHRIGHTLNVPAQHDLFSVSSTSYTLQVNSSQHDHSSSIQVMPYSTQQNDWKYPITMQDVHTPSLHPEDSRLAMQWDSQGKPTPTNNAADLSATVHSDPASQHLLESPQQVEHSASWQWRQPKDSPPTSSLLKSHKEIDVPISCHMPDALPRESELNRWSTWNQPRSQQSDSSPEKIDMSKLPLLKESRLISKTSPPNQILLKESRLITQISKTSPSNQISTTGRFSESQENPYPYMNYFQALIKDINKQNSGDTLSDEKVEKDGDSNMFRTSNESKHSANNKQGTHTMAKGRIRRPTKSQSGENKSAKIPKEKSSKSKPINVKKKKKLETDQVDVDEIPPSNLMRMKLRARPSHKKTTIMVDTNDSDFDQESFSCDDEEYSTPQKRMKEYLEKESLSPNIKDSSFLKKVQKHSHKETEADVDSKGLSSPTERKKSPVKKTSSGKKPQPTTCSFCGLKLSNVNNLSQHMRLHSGERPYKCYICSLAFPRSDYLKDHCKKYHCGPSQSGKGCCYTCGMQFSTVAELKTHVSESHDDVQPFCCNLCPSSYLDIVELKHHVRLSHKLDDRFTYKCALCKTIFVRACVLSTHIQEVHGFDEERFLENTAQETMEDSDDDDEGMTSEGVTRLRDSTLNQPSTYNENSYTQQVCKVQISDSQQPHLKRTLDNSSAEKLESMVDSEIGRDSNIKTDNFLESNTPSVSESKLLPHNSVESNENNSAMKDGKKPKEAISLKMETEDHTDSFYRDNYHSMCECTQCGKCYVLATSLNNHMHKKHAFSKYFKCGICTSDFMYAHELLRHMRRTHNGKRDLTCEKCGKCFSDWSQLRPHLKLHSTERPYICRYCGKGFKWLEVLTSHERTHTGQKPFACKTCGVAFAQRVSLNYHERGHLGVKPYKCEICGNSYTRQTSLNRHLDHHKGLRRITCPYCTYMCDSKKPMRKHLGKVHNDINPEEAEEALNMVFVKRLSRTTVNDDV